MPVGFSHPGYPKDLIHINRWMCSNCGLIFDFDPNSAPDELGWPAYDPPLDQGHGWIDEKGVFHSGENQHKEICPRCSAPLDDKPLVRVIISRIKLIEDIKPLIELGEGQTIEFMKIFPNDRHEFTREVAAFCMGDGGTIFLGVKDDGEILGLEGIDSPTAVDKLTKLIRDEVAKINPKVEAYIDFVQDGNTKIVLITIPMGIMPCYSLGGITYLRFLDQSRKIEGDELARVVAKRWQEIKRQ